MEFVTNIIHKVADPAGAAAFLCETLGFQAKQELEQNVIIVGNGALDVRLVNADEFQQNYNQLILELQTNDIVSTTKTLLKNSNVKAVRENFKSRFDRVETHLNAPHNFLICVAQEFNEDQLGILPPLPKSLEWDEDAEEMLKDIIRIVPIEFRAGARKRATEYAEMLAGEQASIVVDIVTAIRGIAEATPLFQHTSLRAALLKRGIDASEQFNIVPS